nr:unnamed protein product [Naegleria fowleri]
MLKFASSILSRSSLSTSKASSCIGILLQHNNNNQTRENRRFVLPGPKSLDQIVKVPLLERETPEAIIKIWKDHHEMNPLILAETVPYTQYQVLKHRSKDCPMFVLPVFKNIGFQTVVLQFQTEHVLFTSMREFKAKGEWASPQMSLTHFTEFSQTKGIVLMRGETNDAHINKAEGRELARFMYKFYLDDNLYHTFVEVFNKEPSRFNFEELINAVKALKPPKPRPNPLVPPPKMK